MRRLLKFARLERLQRRLVWRTILAVALVRMGLWLLPFKTLCTILGAIEKRNDSRGRHRPPETLERLVWALKIAGRTVPAATCLTQALAAKVVLRKNGYRPILRIGAIKSKRGKFLAHAWLEHEGSIVIGDLGDLSRYASFPPLDFDG